MGFLVNNSWAFLLHVTVKREDETHSFHVRRETSHEVPEPVLLNNVAVRESPSTPDGVHTV